MATLESPLDVGGRYCNASIEISEISGTGRERTGGFCGEGLERAILRTRGWGASGHEPMAWTIHS